MAARSLGAKRTARESRCLSHGARAEIHAMINLGSTRSVYLRDHQLRVYFQGCAC
jgi:hypothetical protein